MILTRGARITGAVLCAVLAVSLAGWLIRDLAAADDAVQLWRYWAGSYDVRTRVLPATSASDLVLLVVCVVAAVASMRSSVAAATLVATGVITLAVRLPGLWTIGAPRMDTRFPDELRTRALVTAFVAVAAGLALIIVAAAGRRPPAGPGETGPTRPGTGPSVAAFLFLGAAGAVLIAWDIRQVVRVPELLPDWYLDGDRILQALIDPPPGWATAAGALLCLYAGCAALGHAVHARPFGMVAAALVLAGGAQGIYRIAHYELLDGFADQSTETRLLVLSWLFEAVAGAVVLLALAPRGLPDVPAPPPGRDYSGGYGEVYGVSPQPGGQPPSGYGYPPPGYGYPQSGSGHPQDGFGPPPPPSRPPPGW